MQLPNLNEYIYIIHGTVAIHKAHNRARKEGEENRRSQNGPRDILRIDSIIFAQREFLL